MLGQVLDQTGLSPAAFHPAVAGGGGWKIGKGGEWWAWDEMKWRRPQRSSGWPKTERKRKKKNGKEKKKNEKEKEKKRKDKRILRARQRWKSQLRRLEVTWSGAGSMWVVWAGECGDREIESNVLKIKKKKKKEKNETHRSEMAVKKEEGDEKKEVGRKKKRRNKKKEERKNWDGGKRRGV